MADGEPLVCSADNDDPYFTLRHSGGPMVAIALLPALRVICFAGGHPGSSVVWLLPGALVPIAVVAAVWEFLLERRAIVEIRLALGELTPIRASGRSARYPLRAVWRIEVVRNVQGGEASSSRPRLYIAGRIEGTRRGRADLPQRWTDAITKAEIDLDVRERHYED